MQFRPMNAKAPGALSPLAKGKNAVCALHSCHSAIARGLLAVLSHRPRQREQQDRPVEQHGLWGCDDDERTIAHSANDHIIGWRVIASTPLGALTRGAPGSAGLPLNDPTSRMLANHMTKLAPIPAPSPAVHNGAWSRRLRYVQIIHPNVAKAISE